MEILRGLVAGLAVGGLFVAAGPGVFAHPFLSDYLQHRLVLARDGDVLEVGVVVTFFEAGSLQERAAMDTDHDGVIRHGEISAYVRERSEEWQNQFRLCLDGQWQTPLLLYEPEVDLGRIDRVVAAHHRLDLHYFVSIPAAFKPGDEVIIEDRLWPNRPAMGILQLPIGQRLWQAEKTTWFVHLPDPDADPPRLRALWLGPPGKSLSQK